MSETKTKATPKVATGAEVREFLRSKGITVGSRGRHSAEHIELYNKAKRGRKVYTEPRHVEA